MTRVDWVDDGRGRPHVAVGTDVVVGLLRGHRASEAAVEAAMYIFGRTPAISSLTRFELERGPRDARGRQRLEALLSGWPVWPFASGDAASAASLAGAPGCRAGELDLLVAAVAVEREAPLLTHAAPTFRRIPGLRVWDASAPPPL